MGNYWTYWCDTSGTASTITVDTTWTTWTTASTMTTAATYVSPTVIWYEWSTADTGTATTPVVTIAPAYVQRTEAELAADVARWEEERRVTQARAAAAAEVRRLACEMARRLLLSMLSEQQRVQLQTERFFEVIARHSKRRYRIREGTHGNVKLLDESGREVTSYCGQPNGVPTEDSMLAQKLQIEHDEEAFLKVANATRLRVA